MKLSTSLIPSSLLLPLVVVLVVEYGLIIPVVAAATSGSNSDDHSSSLLRRGGSSNGKQQQLQRNSYDYHDHHWNSRPRPVKPEPLEDGIYVIHNADTLIEFTARLSQVPCEQDSPYRNLSDECYSMERFFDTTANNDDDDATFMVSPPIPDPSSNDGIEIDYVDTIEEMLLGNTNDPYAVHRVSWRFGAPKACFNDFSGTPGIDCYTLSVQASLNSGWGDHSYLWADSDQFDDDIGVGKYGPRDCEWTVVKIWSSSSSSVQQQSPPPPPSDIVP